jgi:hypothetical protein
LLGHISPVSCSLLYPPSVLCFGSHIYLFRYVFHCTAIECDPLLGVHRRMGTWAVRCVGFFDYVSVGGSGILRLEARYNHLFFPTQFDRFVWQHTDGFPIFFVCALCMDSYFFTHFTLRWIRFLVADLFIQSVFRCLVCRPFPQILTWLGPISVLFGFSSHLLIS